VTQLTKHKRFQRSFELSEGDVWLPKLFRQTVPQLQQLGQGPYLLSYNNVLSASVGAFKLLHIIFSCYITVELVKTSFWCFL